MAASPELTATVLVPTTGDRGPLLPLSVGSILAQSITDLEVFIVGDGVDEETRRTIYELSAKDSRVRFFDHPKHARRGEPYRHEALKEARGRIVCYLCDRDLMLPNHVAGMARALERADFAHSLIVKKPKGVGFDLPEIFDYRQPAYRARFNECLPPRRGIPLSMAAHTLAFYRSLPKGWHTTPEDIATDFYMWHQFLTVPGCRVGFVPVPTIIYLKRGGHPGLPTEARRQETAPLFERYIHENGAEDYARDMLAYLASRAFLLPRLRRWGKPFAKAGPGARMLHASGKAAYRLLTFRSRKKFRDF